MGLFDTFFANQIKKTMKAANSGTQNFTTFTAYQPSFTSWSGSIYENMMIRAAIEAGARHASKLKVEFRGTAKPALRAAMRIGPNKYQTWPKFLARLWTLRNVNNTAFIIPQFNEFNELCGYFPVLASNVTLVEMNGSKEPFLQYFFANGDKGAMEYAKCAVLPKFQYRDDFFGEGNAALDPTLQLISIANQGIQEAVRSSAYIRFMAQLNNFGKAKDAAKTSKEFTESMLKGEGGAFLLYPNNWANMTQIKTSPYTVDTAQMKQISDNVCNYFGVSEAILQNTATPEQLDSFFEGALEPFAIMLSDELTRMTFTPREIAQGNRVVVTANRLQYMSTANKISMAKEMGSMGVLKEDEIRELFNYDPLGEENGGEHRPIRGEFYFADVGKTDDRLTNDGGEANE